MNITIRSGGGGGRSFNPFRWGRPAPVVIRPAPIVIEVPRVVIAPEVIMRDPNAEVRELLRAKEDQRAQLAMRLAILDSEIAGLRTALGQ